MGNQILEHTTIEQRELLHKYRFVHVTGLVEWGPTNAEHTTIGYELPATYLGRWDNNGGVMVIYTMGGEVWLSSSGPMSILDESYNITEYHDLLEGLCPYGQGARAPCSNGEWIHSHDILRRLRNPDSTPLV